MTQVFNEAGTVTAVTALIVGPCTVVQLKTMDKDGYEAVQLGFEEPKKPLNKPLAGHMKNTGQFKYLREVSVNDLSGVELGQRVDVGLFKTGDRVDVIGTSKGKGFAGGVKRHHFKGGPKTHGQSDRHRAPGSIGAGTSPGRVLKGLRMAGQMGNARSTVQHLEVVQSDPDRNLLLLNGAVPGPKQGLVIIRMQKAIG